MAYTINMPGANQRINDTQPLILGNFNEIETDFGRNHVGLLNATAANRGKHALVTFPRSGAGLALANDEMKIYNALNATTTHSELYVQRDIAGVPDTAIPFTASVHTAADGWSYLPSGLLIKYGHFLNTNGGAAHTFTGPVFTQNPKVVVTPRPNVGFNSYIAIIESASVNNVTLRTYRTTTPGGVIAFDIEVDYIAIGI